MSAALWIEAFAKAGPLDGIRTVQSKLAYLLQTAVFVVCTVGVGLRVFKTESSFQWVRAYREPHLRKIS